MTPHDSVHETEAGDEEEVCPHCGAVLELARAMQNERGVRKPKAGRAAPNAPHTDPAGADDPGVA